MIPAERHARILARLGSSGIVRVTDLVEDLGVSEVTVRRDLSALDERGQLQKVHGGARAARPVVEEPGFLAKSALRLPEKAAIARRAVELIEPGMSVAVSAGTTTHLLAQLMVGIRGLTVVTNSVWVGDILHRAHGDSTSVLLTGGMRTISDALVGPLANAALASMHVDVTFMGTHGMDAATGFSAPNLLEAETDRQMIRSADQLVVLADSSKWGVTGLSSMGRLDEADVVITDHELAPEHQAAIRRAGVRLDVVDPGESQPVAAGA